MSATCELCGAPIVWAVDELGVPLPVDSERRPEGTIVLAHIAVGEPPIALVQNAGQRELLAAQSAARGETLQLFVAHPCAINAGAGIAPGQMTLAELDVAGRVAGESPGAS